MRIIPTSEALWNTIWWVMFACSLIISISALWGWSLANMKLDEIMDTAEFNDLDGDGISNVIIVYK